MIIILFMIQQYKQTLLSLIMFVVTQLLKLLIRMVKKLAGYHGRWMIQSSHLQTHQHYILMLVHGRSI